MKKRLQGKLPPKAIVIGDFIESQNLLTALWRAARESGYQVLENYTVRNTFTRPSDQEHWFCTHEIQEEHGNINPLLSIWQKAGAHPECYLVVEASEEEIEAADTSLD